MMRDYKIYNEMSIEKDKRIEKIIKTLEFCFILCYNGSKRSPEVNGKMKNEYKITKKEMMSWAKEYHLHGTANIILFALWCVVGVIGLTLIILYSFIGGDWIDWYLSVWFLFVSIFKLFFSRFLALSQRYKLFSKTSKM